MGVITKTKGYEYNAPYRTLLNAAGSHVAARAAGTYGLGHGAPLVASGVGSLAPLAMVYIADADFPIIREEPSRLRLRVQLCVNDVAPGGNYTVGLYPVTRPATSGGAGLCIMTLGTVVPGSTVLFTAPAADSILSGTGTDFALPADGFYVIGVVTSAIVATSSLVQINAQLQQHNQ